jgi:hypothetical protein
MADDTSKNKDSKAIPDDDDHPADPPEGTVREKEIGGRDGPDPTRYGDWEKNGRCIDF